MEEFGLIIYKTRNLVYYWEIDKRPNPNYHTPLSQLRERINKCLLELEDNLPRSTLLMIKSCIPPTVRREDVPDIIEKIKELSRYNEK